MFLKKQIQIKIIIPYVVIFITSFLINFLCLNPNNPITYPDTKTYLDVTSEIRQFKLPNFSIRTPIYPLYQSIFKNTKSSIIPNLIIASVGNLLLYWIIIQLTDKSKKFLKFSSTIKKLYKINN